MDGISGCMSVCVEWRLTNGKQIKNEKKNPKNETQKMKHKIDVTCDHVKDHVM